MKLAILLACSVSISWCFCTASQAMPRSMFEMSETFSADTSRFRKWNEVVNRNRDQAGLPNDACGELTFHPCHTLAWRDLLKRWVGLGFKGRLAAVNTYANTYPYIVDIMNWGVEDFWSTPYEFMVKDGDCEDYAIAKYVSLRATGVPANRLRIIIVQDMNLGGVVHAVLGVYDDKNTLYILDNQIEQVVKASSIYHYKPIYGINEKGWWAYTPNTIGG